MSSSQLGQAFQQIQSNGTAMRPIAGPPKNMPLPGNEGIVPPGQVAPPPLTLPNMGVDVGFRGGAISPYSPSPPQGNWDGPSPPGSYNSGQAYRRGAQDYFRNDLAGDPQARSQAAFDELQQRNPDMAARFGRQNVGQYIPFMNSPAKRGLLTLPAER